MPIEVTPPPFANQQLPYTPKFVRQEIEGMPGAASAISRGPASAAASAIIPPQPGAISSPHRAIPALPDAGYTSATLHAPSIQPPTSYGPAYQPHHAHPMHPHSPIGYAHSGLSSLYSDGWMPASLPAPRRGPPSALPPPESAIAPNAQHHHDAASDASYYARPKTRRHQSDRSETMSVSSGETSPREHVHRRAMSQGHHRRPIGLPPAPNSPRSRSPLAHTKGTDQLAKSPLSPRRADLTEEKRGRCHNLIEEHKHNHEDRASEHGHHRHHSHSEHLAPRDRPAEQGHHRHHSHSEHLVPDSGEEYEKVRVQGDIHRRRIHSHHTSMIPPPQSRRSPSPAPIAPGSMEHQHIHSPYRRTRAISMQHPPSEDHLSPGIAAGFGGMNMGIGRSLYQTPSVVGVGEQDFYDDGSSIAGSALTFLDGQVDGRTSQYGLPKYPKEMKPDYRRFCVQRGKADVYLD